MLRANTDRCDRQGRQIAVSISIVGTIRGDDVAFDQTIVAKLKAFEEAFAPSPSMAQGPTRDASHPVRHTWSPCF